MSGQLEIDSSTATDGRSLPPEVIRAHRTLLDPETEMPGWVLLLDRTTVALSRARRMHRAVAVFVIDHPFDATNGEEGSADALIARLRSHIRPDDTMAVLGVGRYALLCSDLRSPTDAESITERLTRQLSGAFSSARLSVAVGGGDDDAIELLGWAVRE